MAEDPTDEELMIAYQRGSEDAFSSLYRRHSGRVFGFLKSKIRDEALVHDVFQGTFMKLHKSRAKYDASFPFVPWLFTICRNAMIDALRKKARIQEDFVETLPEAAPETTVTPEIPADLSGLPPKQRAALELRFNHDFSFEEIASRLETSPLNARQLVSRAVKSLRGSHGKN